MDYVVLISNGGKRQFYTLEDVMMDSFGPSVEVAAYTIKLSLDGSGFRDPFITEDMSKGCEAFERAIYHMLSVFMRPVHTFYDGLYVVAGFCSEYSKKVYLQALKPSRKNIYEDMYNTALLKQYLGVNVHKRTWNTPLRMGDFLTNI